MSTDAYLGTLWDCAPDALLVFDDRSVIHYVNQQSERLFGYVQAELLRHPLTLLMPSGLRQLPTTGAPIALSLEARHKAGRRIAVEVALSRAELPTGALFTAACRTRALLPLAAANRGKSDFLANMSHELRSPLNVIIGFAKLMYRKRVGEVSDAQREYLGDILDSGEHLLELIDDMVALAKLEAGKLELRPEPLSLPLLLLELHEAVESLARTRGIELALAASDGVIEHDPDALKQVLVNILSCAVRATPEAGSLQLQALPDRDAHDHVRFEITGGSTFAADCVMQLSDGGLRSVLTARLAEQLGARIGTGSEPTTLSVLLPRCAASAATTPNLRPGGT